MLGHEGTELLFAWQVGYWGSNALLGGELQVQHNDLANVRVSCVDRVGLPHILGDPLCPIVANRMLLLSNLAPVCCQTWTLIGCTPGGKAQHRSGSA